MKIIDCFTFFNELDMLLFRLEYLFDTIDYFVLVEATYSHKGTSKPLFYSENLKKFEKYKNKIIHVIVDDMPNTENNWDNEKFQRICINRGLMKIELNKEDLIIISDIDEIPDKNTLVNISINDNQVYSLKQDMYYYNLLTKQQIPWYAAKICKYMTFCNYDSNAARIRLLDNYNFGEGVKIPRISKGGWHLSYFGSNEFIKNKINTIVEGGPLWKKMYGCDVSTDIISEKKRKGLDLYGRNIKFLIVELGKNTYLPEGYEKFTFLYD